MSSILMSADEIRDLYADGCDKYECRNLGCRNKEVKEAKFKSCGKCRKTKYCSRDCQIAAWPLHKTTCKQWRGLQDIDDKSNGIKRVGKFMERYSPLCGSVVQQLFPSKIQRQGKIAVITLEDLPQDCKFPRLKIESIGRLDISDLPGHLEEECTKVVQRERKLAQDPNSVICALVTHIKQNSFMVSPFIFYDEEEVFKGKMAEASKTVLDLYCQAEADRIVGTINSLARGERNDLKSATKRPSGTTQNRPQSG